HADRKLAYSAEDRELAEAFTRRVRRGGSGNELVKPLEESECLCAGTALDGLRHQRSGRLADGAAIADEARIGDRVIIVEPQPYRELVAAQRIVARCMRRRVVERVEVARIAVVIENHALVEVVQIAHQPKTSRTRPSAETKASTSLVSL